MSIRIDTLVEYIKNSKNYQTINNKSYIAKWYGGSGSRAFINRIKDAIRVFLGTSRAYHFKEDE